MTQAESIGLAALVIEKEEETDVSREFRVSEDENSAKGLQFGHRVVKADKDLRPAERQKERGGHAHVILPAATQHESLLSAIASTAKETFFLFAVHSTE